MPYILAPPAPSAWLTALNRFVAGQQLARYEHDLAKQQEASGGMGGTIGGAVGTVGGAAVGAKIGAVGGPLGAVIGGAVGGIAGTLADPPKQGKNVNVGARNQQLGGYIDQGIQGYMGHLAQQQQQQTPMNLASEAIQIGARRQTDAAMNQGMATASGVDLNRLLAQAGMEQKWLPQQKIQLAQLIEARDWLQSTDDLTPEAKAIGYQQLNKWSQQIGPGIGMKEGPPTIAEWEKRQLIGETSNGIPIRWDAQKQTYVELKKTKVKRPDLRADTVSVANYVERFEPDNPNFGDTNYYQARAEKESRLNPEFAPFWEQLDKAQRQAEEAEQVRKAQHVQRMQQLNPHFNFGGAANAMPQQPQQGPPQAAQEPQAAPEPEDIIMAIEDQFGDPKTPGLDIKKWPPVAREKARVAAMAFMEKVKAAYPDGPGSAPKEVQQMLIDLRDAGMLK